MKKQLTVVLLLLLPNLGMAGSVDDLLQHYVNAGAGSFSASKGAALWSKKVSAKADPRQRSCSTCHGADLTMVGKHQRTGKRIAPMATSVNPKRLTDQKKIEKWFRRNCKWTWGRECTPQEKGDIIMLLRSQ